MSFNTTERCLPEALAPSRVVALVAAVLLMSACDEGMPEQRFFVSDSAGVRIAESVLPAWRPGDAWLVGDTPSVVIGMADGPTEYLLSNVVSTWRLDDGRIVVGERSAAEGMVRFYDRDGTFLHRVGARGSGPGEVQFLLTLEPYRRDSIATWDPLQQRVSVFDEDGSLGRTQLLTIPMDDASATGDGPAMVEQGGVVGFFDDGTLLIMPSRVTSRGGETVPWEPHFIRYSPEGEPLSAIEPKRSALSARDGPFAPRFVWVAHGNAFYSGAGGEYEIRVHNKEGRLERVIRASYRDRTFTEETRERYWQIRRENVGSDESALREVEQELRELEFPSTLPAYAELHVDGEDHLWVGHYRLPGEEGPHRWDIFDPTGRFLGEVETPERLQIHQIASDFVLGVRRDDLDVPQVRVYPLLRR